MERANGLLQRGNADAERHYVAGDGPSVFRRVLDAPRIRAYQLRVGTGECEGGRENGVIDATISSVTTAGRQDLNRCLVFGKAEACLVRTPGRETVRCRGPTRGTINANPAWTTSANRIEELVGKCPLLLPVDGSAESQWPPCISILLQSVSKLGRAIVRAA